MQDDGHRTVDEPAEGSSLPEKSLLFDTSERLLETVAPAEENPVFDLLARRWRKNVHGAGDRTLRLAAALAVVSALLVPAGVFSFFIWHALFFAFTLRPGFAFCGRLRQATGDAADLLSAPLPSQSYVEALRSLFAASALYAAIPYAVYWTALLALRPAIMPGLFAASTGAAVAAGAVLYFCFLTSLLWFAYWCWAAGGWWRALPSLLVPLVGIWVGDSGQILGLEPFPTSPGRWILAFNLLAFGYLISVVLAGSLTERVRG